MPQGGYEMATLLIASYGAIIATVSLILAIILGIKEIGRHKPRIRVSANYGVIHEQNRGSSEPLIFMEAVNTGHRPVTIIGVGWLLASGGKLAFTTPLELKLPNTIEEGIKILTYWRCSDFQNYEENKKIIAPYFKDATGKIWKGRITRKQRKLWLKAGDKGWKIQPLN